VSSRQTAAIQRTAGRVLLLDPARTVLLLQHRLDLTSADTVWAAPGGGCEPGETPAAAARRELAEECGITVDLAADESAISSERRRWYFDESAYDQVDYFFVVRVSERPAVVAGGRTALEEQTVLGYRWFSSSDLRESQVRYEPADLPALLESLA
jgi:8-oxo-dGTP pyrophosphatase MutT (NUDIX family)